MLKKRSWCVNGAQQIEELSKITIYFSSCLLADNVLYENGLQQKCFRNGSVNNFNVS